MKHWKDLSIATRLYAVFGVMAVLIAGELLTLRFSMGKLSAVRAFVGGEGSWSKAQKNAAFSLQRYAATHNEKDYDDFLEYLQIPLGDRQARLEILKADPDLGKIRQGFIQGHIHPDDVDPMVDLLRNFYWVKYLNQALQIWTQADSVLDRFRDAGGAYHEALTSRPPNLAKATEAGERLRNINRELTKIEEDFSYTLGEGSRWLERVVFSVLFLLVLTVESIGLTLTFRTSRHITRGLARLNEMTGRLGKGEFRHVLGQRSGAAIYADEIGTLTESIYTMGELLDRSYSDLEKRVAERTSELKVALEARDEFLSIASHELRTPLTVILLQLQQATRRSEEYTAVLEKPLRQAKKLTALIEELLDLTRIRAGKLKLMREEVDLKEILQEVISDFSQVAARSGNVISMHAPAGVIGFLDRTRMSQVVTNLISNAIKYGDGKPIEVTLHITNGENPLAVLSVRDQGLGIEPENQAIIFKRFERAERDSSISGLGLGLYITRQILDAHGGTVEVKSERGQGSIFTVTIPLSDTRNGT
jgi:signal transduction histidine kinase